MAYSINIGNYVPNEWLVGLAITQERMTNIENGILNAHAKADDLNNVAIPAVNSSISDLNTQINEQNVGLVARVSSLESAQSTSATWNTQGHQAWVQIEPLLKDKQGADRTLKQYIVDTLELQITNNTDSLERISAELQAARASRGNATFPTIFDSFDSAIAAVDAKVIEGKGTYSTLGARFLAIEGNNGIGGLAARMDAAEGHLNASAGEDGAIETRIERIDTAVKTAARGNGATSLNNRFEISEQKLTDALTSTAKGNTTFSSIDTRFEEIESEIVAARGSRADLDARLDKIDSLADSESLAYTVNNNSSVIGSHTSAISNLSDGLSASNGRISSLEGQIVNKVNRSDIVNNETTAADVENKVLDARMGKTLHDEITTASNNLSTSIGAVADRATALEGRATQLESDVSGINTALAGKVAYTDIIDDLTQVTEQTVNKVLDAQVGVDLSERIDAISEQLTGGFEDRIDVLETVLDLDENGDSTRLDGIDALLNGVLESAANNDTTYASVDARLEADEISINGMTANVFKIARELEMVSNGSIIDNNEGTSRIDRLETAVNALPSTSDLEAIGDQVDAVEARVDALYLEDENEPGTYTGIVQDLLDADTSFDSRLDALEETVDTPTTGLSARMTAAETSLASKAAASDLTTLAGRVTVLENTPKSATVIVPNTNITYDESTGLPTIYTTAEKTTTVTPTETSDYLLQGSDGSYYYWKYMTSGGWQRISGGNSSSGNNSGYDLLAEEYDDPSFTPAENSDYYVARADGIHHYRWVTQTDANTGEETLEEVEIGSPVDATELKKYNVRVAAEDVNGTNVYYLYLYEFEYWEDNEINDISEELTQEQLAYLATKQIRKIPLPATGGGGGYVSNMKFTRITANRFSSIFKGVDPIVLKFFFTTGQELEDAQYDLFIGRWDNERVSNEKMVIHDGTLLSGDPVNASNVWPSAPIPRGFNSIDITQYISAANDYRIRIVAYDPSNHSITATMVWYLKAVNFSITSNAANGLIVNRDEPVTISYIPFGAIDKTLKVEIDNVLQENYTRTISSNVSGSTMSLVIPAGTMSHGVHHIKLYMEAYFNDEAQPRTSKAIDREYIWYDALDENADAIILASSANGTTYNMKAYSEYSMPYSIYSKDNTPYLVEFYRNYGTAKETLLDQVQYTGNIISTYDYVPVVTQDEIQIITIKIGNKMVSVTLDVEKIVEDVSPIEGAIIDFDPALLTNNSVDREPVWKTATTAFDSYADWISGNSYTAGDHVIYDGYAYACATDNDDIDWTPSHWTELGAKEYTLKVSDNFNWSNDASGGGYREDEDGKCFVIKAGSYVDINYKMFKANGTNSAVFDSGAEMKLVFKVSGVRRTDAIWFTNAKVRNDKRIGIDLYMHKGELLTDKASRSDVTATDSYEDWSSNRHNTHDNYNVGEIVVYDRANTGTIYKCKVQNNDASFDASKWESMGKIENEVNSTNTYLYFPYSEEDKIELDININKHNSNPNINNDFIMSYEDGVPSKALPYTYGAGGDGLYHTVGEEGTIHIGSDECDVYIYRLRIYNRSLTTTEILKNFIADGKTINEKVSRYNRNAIYWDDNAHNFKIEETAEAHLDPIKLAEKMPNVKILMLEAPTFTLNKNSYIKNSSLRCLQIQKDENGDNVYPAEGNWYFYDGYHAGQGTTSDNYGQSGRNVDFLFECDGTNYPAKSKNITDYFDDEEPYVSKLLRGNDTSEWVVDIEGNPEQGTESIYHWAPAEDAVPELCTDWKGDDCKVQLTPTSVPNNYFNLKVNIASSENVNNALFQKRYSQFVNAINPSPATTNQEAAHHYSIDSRFEGPIKVKNSMEFVPAVLFIRETAADAQGNPVGHSEFNDCKWHFYALGNIGDSKKTDYTRAYDPNDMNEFTLEFSDNNTNNGQFQSGVIQQGNTHIVEDTQLPVNALDFIWGITSEEWNATREPTAAEITVHQTVLSGGKGTDVIMGGDENGVGGQVYTNFRHRMLHCEPFDGKHSFEFRYACQGDYRDGDLINPTDKKSERYKLDKAQETLNRAVFEAFYEWVVTATDAQFRNEAELWFVPGAMEFFYAYTHYYTMMDNRAKNTFWHFAKTGTLHAVPIGRANAALMHVYQEEDGNGGYQAATGDFDNTKQYYTEYAFDLWAYDMDTAAGIDNNGALVFPYGKEDTDYRTEGDSLSGMAFNGAGSIFWRRLSTAFAEDIRAIMERAPVECFNSQNLIDEFDTFQDYYPEEIWRLDIERKYIRTFTGVVSNIDELNYDNAVAEGKQNPRFLRSMMQGRKKYQRRQWIRDQGVYFNSKYRLTDIIINGNTNEFNCTTPGILLWQPNTNYKVNDRVWQTPSDPSASGLLLYRCNTANNDATFNALKWTEETPPTYHLKLTPYQDMYLNVQVGNGNYQETYVTQDGIPTLRAKAGQEYTFDIFGNFQETRIYINGSNHLSKIGNLAYMYPYEFDLRALKHIKELEIGTSTAGYSNTKLTSLSLPQEKPLLETLNIQNCSSLGGTIDLSNANNIRTVEATGTAVTSVLLPQYTSIETLHLPITVTDISLYAARSLHDFKVVKIETQNNQQVETIDYSHITKLDIVDSDYDSNINWMDIAEEMLANAESIKLYDLLTSHIDTIEELEPFNEKRQELAARNSLVGLSGQLAILLSYSEIEQETYESIWSNPPLTLIPDVNATKINKCRVDYYYDSYVLDDGTIVQPRLIATEYVEQGTYLPDIYYSGKINKPTRNKTASTEYSWGTYDGNNNYVIYSGWYSSDIQGITPGGNPLVNSPATVYTKFTATKRIYPVKWFMKETDTTPVKTSQARYGEGTALSAPTVSEIHAAGKATYEWKGLTGSVAEYSIFTGWNKLPINIQPTANDTSYNIYATWLTKRDTLTNIFEGASDNNLTIEQLFVLSHINASNRALYIPTYGDGDGNLFTCRMGHDGPDDGTVIVSNPFRTDTNYMVGTGQATPSGVFDNITPFAGESNAFTLVLDYCFNVEAIETNYYTPKAQGNDYQYINRAVLAGCYNVDTTANTVGGFALYYYYEPDDINGSGARGPYFGFGDIYGNTWNNNSVPVGDINNASSRNIIVIRHENNSEILHIYSGYGMDSSTKRSFPSTVQYKSLIWNKAHFNDGLRLGYITSKMNDSNYQSIRNNTAPGCGTIYWAKYWDYDIGDGECQQLATWPHEEITFSFAKALTGQTSASNSAFSLTALESTAHGSLIQSAMSGATSYGWGLAENAGALARTICNQRIFNGLPTMLQAIIFKESVPYLTANLTDSGQSWIGAQEYQLANSISTAQDYVYLPTAYNLASGNVDNDTGAIIPNSMWNKEDTSGVYCWIVPGNDELASLNTYEGYVAARFTWTVQNSVIDRTKYWNLRFPYQPINIGPVRVFSDTSWQGDADTTAYSAINESTIGPIQAGDIFITGNNAYIYVTQALINQYGIQIASATTSPLLAATTGGWVKAVPYLTRSLVPGQSQTNYCIVTTEGNPVTTGPTSSTLGYTFVFSFSV